MSSTYTWYHTVHEPSRVRTHDLRRAALEYVLPQHLLPVHACTHSGATRAPGREERVCWRQLSPLVAPWPSTAALICGTRGGCCRSPATCLGCGTTVVTAATATTTTTVSAVTDNLVVVDGSEPFVPQSDDAVRIVHCVGHLQVRHHHRHPSMHPPTHPSIHTHTSGIKKCVQKPLASQECHHAITPRTTGEVFSKYGPRRRSKRA